MFSRFEYLALNHVEDLQKVVTYKPIYNSNMYKKSYTINLGREML